MDLRRILMTNGDRGMYGFRVDAAVNPFDFGLDRPKGVVAIEDGAISIAEVKPGLSQLQLTRRRPVEIRATDATPVRVFLFVFIRVSSRQRPSHITFRPHDESIESCLKALEREGFTIRPRSLPAARRRARRQGAR